VRYNVNTWYRVVERWSGRVV